MKILNKLLFILTPKERKHIFLILFVTLIVAFFEIAGLASIVPFIAVLSDQDIFENSSKINSLFQASKNLGIQNQKQFLFALGLAVFILLIITLLMKALAKYLLIKFSNNARFNLEKRMVASYLSQSYGWFLNRHSADLGKNILGEVGKVTKGGVETMMNLITRAILAMAFIILLIYVNAKLTFIISVSLGLSYLLIYIFTRGILKHLGNKKFTINRWRFTTVIEAFGAIKEIKLSGLEKNYVDRFSRPAKKLANIEAIFGLLLGLPRLAIEAIAFGGMLLMTLYLMKNNNNFVNIIPTIALYTLAGYRILPLLQGIFESINTLRYNKFTIDTFYDDLKKLQKFNLTTDEKVLNFKKEINLKNINYSYLNSSKLNLKNINLKILAGSSIGIVGITGSGKSTLIDLILGLHKPKEGSLEIDGEIIDDHNRRSWQKTIGYVPQQIFLFDDTVESNIAFGQDPELIDQEAVEKAAKIANIHEFIENELPLKYKTQVGERGIRLSGGQKQRLGIARALYHNPKILVLDEATNALDSQTESLVLKEIKKIKKDRTIITITHRINSVKDYDKIIYIEEGEIKQEGKFEDFNNNMNDF
ncbi:ABC transporter ATP-binding protein [Candidatus Pelagibacter sp.]|nr:ABC transporter ATP-binding protein [Candidatus Pelagibacter sp.]